ncbi:MAG: hypothetical protein K2I23_07600 [Clostridia bacterium]|nr:hypothetical protein [Clostridia bacterium]
MEKKLNKKTTAIISLAIVIALITVIIAGVVIYGGVHGKLKFNYELGAVAVEKVENAQYTPDIDKYYEVNASQLNSVMSASTQSSNEEFTALIDEYATVYNYAGAGKYLGYDIYEIKDEVKFVVEHVPAFNQWFRMPTMREEQGFASIPYYEGWAYYLEMNEETSVLSITRVCWATRSDYLDFENKKTVEDHADGSSFIQFEVMKINYLETEKDEIVECFIYSVGVDHVGSNNFLELFNSSSGYYNDNVDDYYPFEFQYLRNVKDKSMVKYHITVANRYRDDESFDEGGMDIRGLNPYGVRREFTIVNYDGYTDIDVTKIDQKFATLDKPQNNGEVDFDVYSNNIKILLSTIGYKESIYGMSPEQLLDEISKHIIDNFEIKNNWPTIYKGQDTAIEVEELRGPFYGKEMWVEDLNVYVSCRGHYQDEIEFDAHADIHDMSKMDFSKEYSLSMALKSRETGKIFILATDYQQLEKVHYNGSNRSYYRLKVSSIELKSSEVVVDEDGTYDVVCVLTIKEDGQDVILCDTQEIGYLRQYRGLTIPDSVDSKGVTHKYTVSGVGGKLTIKVTSAR